MNSTYDYDPASRRDELVDIVAKVLHVIVPVVRPDVAVTVGAFPWCESIRFPASCLTMRRIYPFEVLYLPACFPGMSFKREMAIARELSKEGLQRPFEYALQKQVLVPF